MLSISSCQLNSNKKPYPEFKYWSTQHNIGANSAVHKFGSFNVEILTFEASERRSVFGRESWNINVQVRLTNTGKETLWMKELGVILKAGTERSGNTASPRPTGPSTTGVWITNPKPALNELNSSGIVSGKSALTNLAFTFGSYDLIEKEILLYFESEKKDIPVR